jgi:twitching motility protein PilT
VDLRRHVPDPTATGLLEPAVARRLRAIPVEINGPMLLVAMADPSDEQALEELALRTTMMIEPGLSLSRDVMAAIESAYPPAPVVAAVAAKGADVPAPKRGATQSALVAKAEPKAAGSGNGHSGGVTRLGLDERGQALDLHDLFMQVLVHGASDLHLTNGLPPMLRVDGDVMPLTDQPVLDQEILRRVIYGMLSQKQRDRFETDLELDFSYSMPGKWRFRVNVYQQRGILGAAFRLIPFEIKTVEDLGVPPQVEEFARIPRGLVVVTGPTGSGKSTTLAALLDVVNREKACHIMTIEDPIEFIHPHRRAIVNQREVGEDTHSFAEALKHVLRQDPDVILVGEMRDIETMQMAVTAAETGHLVFATLHTQDAAQTVDRIIDAFPPGQQQQIRVQLAGSLQGVVAQQLLPRRDSEGRIPACEVLMVTPAVRNLIREGKTHQLYSVMQSGGQFGMMTMDSHLAQLTKKGEVAFEIAKERCHSVEEFSRLSGGGGTRSVRIG